MLTLKGSDLPLSISGIPDPPTSLYCAGRDLKELLNLPRIAVVGSRWVTPYGRLVTSQLSRQLAEEGIVIISGLALGIDAIAHQACLEAGGATIAVLPGSIDDIYPHSHRGLAQKITDFGGCLVSEMAKGSAIRPHHFLIRNRLISGLAEGVLVTEAAERSGSLNTAKHALEQGRTVFAVPGNINSEMSAGTNNLIKAGAIPVTGAADILRAMNWPPKKAEERLFKGTPEEELLFNLIKDGLNNGEELLVKSGLKEQQFNLSLSMLEIYGIIQPLGGNSWTIR